MRRAPNSQQIVTSCDIGEKIRRRRREMGLSQERLAELLGVTYQQVQRYERGSNRLSIERLQQIAMVMSVPFDFFLAPKSTARADEINPLYLAGDESLLLAHFRRIVDHEDRQLVVALARLVARKDGATDLLHSA